MSKHSSLRRIFPTLLFLATIQVSAAFSADLDAADIQQSMQGQWTITDYIFHGKHWPSNTNKVVTIDGNQWRHESGGKATATFKINADQSPAHIDFTLVVSPEIRGRAANDTAWGIVSVENDTMRICHHLGRTRPKNFDGDKAILLILKRLPHSGSPAPQ